MIFALIVKDTTSKEKKVNYIATLNNFAGSLANLVSGCPTDDLEKGIPDAIKFGVEEVPCHIIKEQHAYLHRNLNGNNLISNARVFDIIYDLVIDVIGDKLKRSVEAQGYFSVDEETYNLYREALYEHDIENPFARIAAINGMYHNVCKATRQNTKNTDETLITRGAVKTLIGCEIMILTEDDMEELIDYVGFATTVSGYDEIEVNSNSNEDENSSPTYLN